MRGQFRTSSADMVNEWELGEEYRKTREWGVKRRERRGVFLTEKDRKKALWWGAWSLPRFRFSVAGALFGFTITGCTPYGTICTHLPVEVDRPFLAFKAFKMWRDRIAGQSTVSGGNRNPSLPRRSSSQLSQGPYNTRPGITSTNSSTSLLVSPNDSTASLPATGRPSNGTGLRQTSAQRPRPAVVPDPLEVLNGIIRKEKQGKEVLQISAGPEKRPQDLVKSIDFEGLSLEEFVAKAVPKPTRKSPASDVNAQTIQQFEQERDKFQDLHTAISGCDDVSKSVELYLNDFQNELGAVSAEIETLQTRSTQLNAMLENRRNVERLLGPAVEEISISPKAVRAIVEGPMDENWVRALNEIDARTTGIEAKASSSAGFKAIEDVRPLLIDVKNKVETHL